VGGRSVGGSPMTGQPFRTESVNQEQQIQQIYIVFGIYSVFGIRYSVFGILYSVFKLTKHPPVCITINITSPQHNHRIRYSVLSSITAHSTRPAALLNPPPPPPPHTHHPTLHPITSTHTCSCSRWWLHLEDDPRKSSLCAVRASRLHCPTD
jgi:hypothetical protein